jgi:hypothetical protein
MDGKQTDAIDVCFWMDVGWSKMGDDGRWAMMGSFDGFTDDDVKSTERTRRNSTEKNSVHDP